MPPTAQSRTDDTTSSSRHDPSKGWQTERSGTISLRVGIYCKLTPHPFPIHLGVADRLRHGTDGVRWQRTFDPPPLFYVVSARPVRLLLPSPHSSRPTRAAGYLERRPSEPRVVRDARMPFKSDRKCLKLKPDRIHPPPSVVSAPCFAT